MKFWPCPLPACSITKPAGYERSDSWIKVYNSLWKYDRKPLLEENRGKIANFFGKTCFESRGQQSDPVSRDHHSVEYSRYHGDGYPKIGWWTYSSHAEHGQLLIEWWILLLSYFVSTLIRQYLTTGRKYALIKKYALNKHVRLLTRLDVVSKSTWTRVLGKYVGMSKMDEGSHASNRIIYATNINCAWLLLITPTQGKGQWVIF